jgi:hypothetical protein
MTEQQDFKRLAIQTGLLSVGLLAALVFGIIVLASGDWLPGVIIVVATLIALGAQIPTIRRLCSQPPPASSPPTGKPAGHGH